MRGWFGGQMERALARYAAMDRRGRVHVWLVAILVLLACALLSVRWSLPAPWEGAAARRLAKGAEFGTDEHIQVGLWWGAIGVGLTLLLLAATSGWWFRWCWASLERARPGDRTVFDLEEWPWLLGALCVAAVFRAAYIDLPVLWDEQDNLRRSYHGYVEVAPDGAEKWRPARFRDALWENDRANNPFLYSVACQASLSAWRAGSGADRRLFDVVAMRFPAFLAGVASIVALWWLAKMLGLRRAAPLAALLAAAHCLHVEYSFQARGYAFVLLFAPLAAGFVALGIRDGLWRWWVGYAVSIFCCLHAFPGAAYFAVALGAPVACLLL